MNQHYITETSHRKVWLITGAGRGIGSDLVKAALDAGHNVIATARNTDSIISEVGAHERLLPLAMDVTDSVAIDDAISQATEHF